MTDDENLPDGNFLVISQEGSISNINIHNKTLNISRTAYRNGYLNNLILYNQDGKRYIVNDCLMEKSSFLKSILSLFSGKIDIKLKVNYDKKCSQGEILKEVLEYVITESEFWSSGEDNLELVNRIESATDVNGIILALGI